MQIELLYSLVWLKRDQKNIRGRHSCQSNTLTEPERL